MSARNVLLLQLDGKLPNLALMRIAAARRGAGDTVVLRRAVDAQGIEPRLDEPEPDQVYASAIFTRSRPLAEAITRRYPGAEVGGTGWDARRGLEDAGIDPNGSIDYSDYPRWTTSLGFTQRGCRLRCPFCVVPQKEGAVRENATIDDIWRGEPWPRHVLLLDNDFFGQPAWSKRIDELRNGGFRVSFNQGVNIRAIGDAEAEALASVDYRDAGMRTRRLYTAWDNRRGWARFERGVHTLAAHGIPPHHLCVYMRIGYWPDEDHEQREWRRRRLRALRAKPYPMPYTRTPELLGYQRWVIGGYDHRIGWDEWRAARYQPRNLRRHESTAALPLQKADEQPAP